MNKISFRQVIPLVVLAIVAILSIFVPVKPNFDLGKYNGADITWILVSSALVLLMTPAVAFFYGGMVDRKNVVSTMMKSIASIGVVSVIWVVVGFSLAFGKDFHGFIGNPMTFLFFQGVNNGEPWSGMPTVPFSLFAIFQMMFAIITPSLVVGALAERMRYTAYVLFTVLFLIFVYAPLAHWSWHPDGFLYKWGALDFAGGTVVHISAGCAALAGAIVLKPRIHKNIVPANIPYVLIGASLLWFGWFGFNAGSAGGATSLAVSAFMTTNTAAAAAGLAWTFMDSVRGRKPTLLGFSVGSVVGLVAITPGAGFVGIPQSIFIGFISALISNYAVDVKNKSKLDDPLDVFPCHGLGGMVGMLLTGIFASKAINPAGNDGLLYGNFAFFFTQCKALIITVVYSFVVSYIIFKLINYILPIRVSAEEEEKGLDLTQHDESYLSRD